MNNGYTQIDNDKHYIFMVLIGKLVLLKIN